MDNLYTKLNQLHLSDLYFFVSRIFAAECVVLEQAALCVNNTNVDLTYESEYEILTKQLDFQASKLAIDLEVRMMIDEIVGEMTETVEMIEMAEEMTETEETGAEIEIVTGTVTW